MSTKIQWTEETCSDGRKVGVIIGHCKRLGISLYDYLQKKERGQKWCAGCKDWHHSSNFTKDRTRYDGLKAYCRSASYRYTPVAEPNPGPKRKPSRDGDKRQARAHVNLSVKSGRLPNPNSISCLDCGHFGVGRRHEYDHFLGYASAHHMDVQIVCTRCHARREKKRRNAD